MKRRNFLVGAAVGVAALPMRAMEAPVREKMDLRKGIGPVRLNVRDAAFGAVGDGVAKDTAAFQAALDRCGVLGGGEVLVPAGTYLIGAIQLRSYSAVRLAEGAVLMGSPEIDEYPVTQVRWEGRWIAGHIGLVSAIDANVVKVLGPGKIVGCEALGGRPTKEKPLRRPALMEFLRCDDVHLQGFSTSYAQMWSIHPTASKNILIEGLTIRSTGGNGDGIDVDSCQRVKISKCDIATGDDCISLKSGRGLEAYTQALITENVEISDCTFADSLFACIGIGSENSGGTRDVTIRRCKFKQAKTFAIYIKSRPGRGAVLEDILVDDVEVSGMQGGFLRINLLNSGLLGEDPVGGSKGIPEGKDFLFQNIRVKDVPVLVQGWEVHPDKPLRGLTLENISGTCAKGISLANARAVVLKNIRVTGYEGPMVSVANVTGKGLEGAATVDAPKVPDAVPESSEPYSLH